MNDRRPTDLELTAALRAHLPAMAGADLRDQINLATAMAPQQRALPSILGPLTDADPIARRRAMLLAAAVMTAVALAGVVAVGALRHEERPILPTGGMGRLAFVKDSDLYVADPDGSNPTLVAHADGAALSRPHWSPDGGKVALQTEESAILVLDVQSGDLQRLVGGALGSWSPDSEELSYFTTNGDIAVVDVDSGSSRILVARPEEGGGFDSGWSDALAWSPDGLWLVDDHANGGFGEPVDLMRIDAATGATATLQTTSDFYQYNPDWAPDSNRVVFGGNDERRAPDKLWVANIDGSGIVEIVDSGGPRSPDWSPDGAWIAYLTSPGLKPPGVLMLVRPDGTGAHSVADKADAIVGWSPDGGSLAYVMTDDNDPGLRTLHVRTIADGTDRVVSLPDGTEDFAFAPQRPDLKSDEPSPRLPAVVEVSPSEPPVEEPAAGDPLQPDATWGGIAFRTPQGEFDCYVGVLRFPDQVSVIEPRRADARPEAPGEEPGLGTPKPQKADYCELPFAPDGSAFVRASQLDATFDVVRMDGTTLAGPFPAETGPPRWSPGGGWLAMTSCPEEGDCQAVIVRPDGSARRDLPGEPYWSAGDRVMAIAGAGGSLLVGRGDGTNLRAIGTFPLPGGWSPDGSTFVFVRDGDAWLAQADGSGVRNLTGFDLGGATGAWWSPDGQWITVAQGSTMWVFSPDGSMPRRLGADMGPSEGSWGPDWAPAWSPDGEWVAIEHEQQTTLFHGGDWRGVRLENAWQPAWSPDGRHLAVVSDDGNGSYQVDVTNPDGAGRVTVSTEIAYPPIAWFQ